MSPQIQSSWDQGDFTGTRVSATAPVYVSSGAKWSSVETMIYPDHLVHALPPVTALGRTYVLSSFAERNRGDIVKIVGRCFGCSSKR